MVEYLITFMDPRIPSKLWCELSIDRMWAVAKAKNWRVEKIEVAAESDWGKEQERMWEEMRYRAELEQAAGQTNTKGAA